LALLGRELAPGLSYPNRHAFPPALRQAAAQNCHQLGLSLRVELFSGIKGISKSDLLTHRDLLTNNNASRVLGAQSAGK
jgi:hypothetical protein